MRKKLVGMGILSLPVKCTRETGLLGLVIVGGQFIAQSVTYFFTPVICVALQRIQQKLESR